jgi:hypothetical protein
MLTTLCPNPQGKCTGWIFTDRNTNNISQTSLVTIWMQMQFSWLKFSCVVTKARATGKNSWFKLEHDENVNNNLSLPLPFSLHNKVSWNYVDVCVWKAYLNISDWQVLAVLCDRHQERCVLKYQSEFSNSLSSRKIQDLCTSYHPHICGKQHPLNN